MADILVRSKDDTGAVRRFRDMGDGTVAEVVSMPTSSAGSAGYPLGATALHGSSGIVSNASAVATLAATAGKRTYLVGVVVTGMGATGASGVALSIPQLVGGQANFMIGVPAGVTTPINPLVLMFPQPIPASADNTAIVCTVGAFGAGNVQASCEAVGFSI